MKRFLHAMCINFSKKLNQAEGTRKLAFYTINETAIQMKAFLYFGVWFCRTCQVPAEKQSIF